MLVCASQICQKCVKAAAYVNVEECTDNVNLQMRHRVNELLVFVNTYMH